MRVCVRVCVCKFSAHFVNCIKIFLDMSKYLKEAIKHKVFLQSE